MQQPCIVCVVIVTNITRGLHAPCILHTVVTMHLAMLASPQKSAATQVALEEQVQADMYNQPLQVQCLHLQK
jgi:hypothetical protein